MVRAARRGNGSGPEVPMSGKEHSSASAEAKVWRRGGPLYVQYERLGWRRREGVILIWWADREWRRAVPAFWKLPFVFHRFYEGFQVFKGFHGLFFKKGFFF